MKITDEMVEKAAQELYYCWNSEPGVKSWSLLTSLRTKPYRVAAERMLSAVAPLIRAEALEEAALMLGTLYAVATPDTRHLATAMAAAIRDLKDTPPKTEPAI